jgi:enoyl-CoA hydratase/carnithine racemase
MTNRAESLLVTLRDGIKRIAINRPERRNSVDLETIAALRDAITNSADDGTGVIILTGAGESCCASADLAATSERDIADFDVTRFLREGVNPTILARRALPVPIIARVPKDTPLLPALHQPTLASKGEGETIKVFFRVEV